MVKWIIKWVLRPKWVVFVTKDDRPELGLMIWGVVVVLYKADVLLYDKAVGIRSPGKREFGESLHPQSVP